MAREPFIIRLIFLIFLSLVFIFYHTHTSKRDLIIPLNESIKKTNQQRNTEIPPTQNLNFEQRSTKLKHNCHSVPKRDLIHDGKAYDTRKFYYSPKHSLLACLVPKAGSSSLKTLMLRLVGIQELLHWNIKVLNQHLIIDALYPGEQSKALVESANLTRVMSVRHPFDRLVSLYLDRLNGGKWADPEWYGHIKRYRSYAKKVHLDYKVPFEEFLKIVLFIKEQDGTYFMEEHTRPAYVICGPCNVKFDFIIRSESLSQDLVALNKHLHLENVDPTMHLHKHSDTAIHSKYDEYFENIDPEDLRKLYHIYRHDLELFEYSPPKAVQDAVAAAGDTT